MAVTSKIERDGMGCEKGFDTEMKRKDVQESGLRMGRIRGYH